LGETEASPPRFLLYIPPSCFRGRIRPKSNQYSFPAKLTACFALQPLQQPCMNVANPLFERMAITSPGLLEQNSKNSSWAEKMLPPQGMADCLY
jgi:hypothetical protein